MTEQAIIVRRASRSPSSWDATKRTFTAILSTGAAVARMDARGAFEEVLNLGQSWPEVIPLLDAHNRESVNAVLGTVSNIRTVNGELIGEARLSAHNPTAQQIAAELSDGATFGVSIGYRVESWTETKTATGKRAKVADKLTLVEASLVPIAADANAGIRSEAFEMPEANTETRSTINAGIRSIGELAGLDRTWCDAQIDSEATLEAARAAAFEEMRTRSATRNVRTASATAGFDGTDPEFIRANMADALFTRIDPAHKPGDAARPYVGLSMADMARGLLSARNVSTLGMGPAAIVERAMSMTTGDFPILLADTMNKGLRASYSAAPSGIKRTARATTNRDFRAKHRIQLSGPLTLEPTNEHGEFKAGAFAEAEETYKLGTFGRIVGFSRQAIVNDDLGGLADPARYLGRAASEFEASTLVALIEANPKMSDTKALFHSSHGNLAGSGAAISVETLSAARLAMRTQKGLSGEPISVTPKYLVVGPDRETEAEKVLHTLSAHAVDDVNVFSGKFELVVEPRLSTAWFLTADPNEIDGLEYAHLEGEGGPQVVSEVGFDVDAIRFRIRLDFGAGFVDWRGWYKNAGGA